MADVNKVVRIGDTLTNLIDSFTKKSVNYRKVTTWYDGTPMTDAKVDGKLYRKKGDEYFREVIDKDGELFLEKDTMAQMRALSALDILLLKAGVYKGVTLNGYYAAGDTPKPIKYSLSTTSSSDDGGSVIEVGGIKLEHRFSILYPEYFGGIGDGIADDTVALQKTFAKVNSVKCLEIQDFKKFKKTLKLNLGSINNVRIFGGGWIHNEDCDGFSGFLDTCDVSLNVRLMNSPSTNARRGVDFGGTKSRMNFKAYTDNDTSQYGIAVRLMDITDNNITVQCHGNRMGLTDANTFAEVTSTLKGIGLQVGYGINNSFTDCYAIYFDRGLDMPLVSHPTAGFANEGSKFVNGRFLWCNNTAWLNVGLGLIFTNMMLDISWKEALIMNNIDRMTFTNSWIATRQGYAPWNYVIDNSKGIIMSNIMLGVGNNNALQIRNSDTIVLNQILGQRLSTSPTTSNIVIESTNKRTRLGRIVGLNVIDQASDTIKLTDTKKLFNLNKTDSELGSGVLPSVQVQNGIGTRIASFIGETTNIFELYGDSNNSAANNFQIGKTSAGFMVRYSGVNGWEDRLVSTYKAGILKRGTTAQRPTGLNSGSDVGTPYYDTDLLAFVFWDGGNWRNGIAKASLTVDGAVKQIAKLDNIAIADLVSVTTADATDLPTALVLLNEIKAKYNLNVDLVNAIKKNQNDELTFQRTAGQQSTT